VGCSFSRVGKTRRGPYGQYAEPDSDSIQTVPWSTGPRGVAPATARSDSPSAPWQGVPSASSARSARHPARRAEVIGGIGCSLVSCGAGSASSFACSATTRRSNADDDQRRRFYAIERAVVVIAELIQDLHVEATGKFCLMSNDVSPRANIAARFEAYDSPVSERAGSPCTRYLTRSSDRAGWHSALGTP
jgi:hypothetical protein